jgi:hypothetical protein
MATGNCTAYPVYGQAFRFYFVVISIVTGLPITGGLDTLLSQISKDGGAFANTATDAVEAPANSGYGYVDLDAAEMSANNIYPQITVSNANGVCFCEPIVPLQLGEESGCSLDQSLILFEQMVRDTVEVLMNGGTYNGYSQFLLNRAGNANLCSRTVSGAPGNGGTGVAGNLE